MARLRERTYVLKALVRFFLDLLDGSEPELIEPGDVFEAPRSIAQPLRARRAAVRMPDGTKVKKAAKTPPGPPDDKPQKPALAVQPGPPKPKTRSTDDSPKTPED